MKIETQCLPQDLIIGILLILPVKSLVRFKGVCKSWRSLISDPNFARSHFELAAPRPVFNSYCYISTLDLDKRLHAESFSEDIQADLFNPCCMSFAGSCRGFMLLDCCDSLHLWNPSTNVHKAIPSAPIFTDVRSFPYSSRFEYVVPHLYGFGYDSSKDDYLVVKFSVRPSLSPSYFAHVQFFSIRANMWKYIEFTDLPRLDLSSDPSPGLLFNGVIHWMAYGDDVKSNNIIIAFDVLEKSLFEIPQPSNIAHDLSSCDLWVHGRFLSLSVMGSDTIDILVMKEYRVQSSWTKTHVLSLSGILYKDKLFPVCSTKVGDIVMENGRKELLKFSDKGELLEHCWYHGFLEFRVPMYTESLFSLPVVTCE